MHLPNPNTSFSAILKSQDPDRFLLSLFVPQSKRDSVLLLDMFYAEVANIPANVTTPHMGMIKLQWWRDEIGGVLEGRKQGPTPLLQELKKLIDGYQLSFADFDQTLTAREFDVLGEASPSIQTLVDYNSQLHTPLQMMKHKILDESIDIKKSWQNVGEAMGLVGMVRSIPYHAGRGRVFIPSLSLSQVKPHSSDVQNIVAEIVTLARARLQNIPESAHRYLRAQAALTSLYCDKLEQVSFDPFHFSPIPFKELRVWWRSR